jgi:hypothetical protein
VRTTVTLDPDVEELVRKVMSERDISFKKALNEALRRALSDAHSEAPYRIVPRKMGEPLVPLDKALRLAGEMEDAAILEKLRQRR